MQFLSHSLLLLAALWQVSDGIQITALGALRAIQDVNIPMYITLIAYWVIALPLGYYLGFFTNLGVYGVWIGLVVGLTLSASVLTYRYLNFLKSPIINS